MYLASRYCHDDAAHSNSRIAIYYHTEVVDHSTVDSTRTPLHISEIDHINFYIKTIIKINEFYYLENTI